MFGSGVGYKIDLLREFTLKVARQANDNVQVINSQLKEISSILIDIDKIVGVLDRKIAKLILSDHKHKEKITELERKIRSFDEELTTMNNYIIKVRQEAKLSAMTGGTNK